MMHKYEVGQLYHPNVRRWPESPQYNFRSGAHELVLFYRSPTAKEVREIKNGVARFALLVPDRRVLFFCATFGLLNSTDSPYSWWRVPEAERTRATETEHPERRILLNVVLVDADTGTIKVLRAVTLSPEFSQALNAAINDQAQQPVSEAELTAAIEAAYRQYPTTDAMVQAAKITCVGGQ